MSAPKTTTTTTPDHTRAHLLGSARQIGAALHGIGAIAELLTESAVDHEAADDGMTARHTVGLLAAAGALARYVRHDLEAAIGPEGEEALLWGGSSHLYPGAYKAAAEASPAT